MTVPQSELTFQNSQAQANDCELMLVQVDDDVDDPEAENKLECANHLLVLARERKELQAEFDDLLFMQQDFKGKYGINDEEIVVELKQLNQEINEVRWKLQHVPDSSIWKLQHGQDSRA